MKRARKDQWVRIADPLSVVCRFWDADHCAVIGAGGMRFESSAIHQLGRVLDAPGKGDRALVRFPGTVDVDGSQEAALWLNASYLVSAAAEGRKRCACEHPRHESACPAQGGCWCDQFGASVERALQERLRAAGE